MLSSWHATLIKSNPQFSFSQNALKLTCDVNKIKSSIFIKTNQRAIPYVWSSTRAARPRRPWRSRRAAVTSPRPHCPLTRLYGYATQAHVQSSEYERQSRCIVSPDGSGSRPYTHAGVNCAVRHDGLGLDGVGQRSVTAIALGGDSDTSRSESPSHGNTHRSTLLPAGLGDETVVAWIMALILSTSTMSFAHIDVEV